MVGVAISRLPISKYLQENVTLARPRVLTLPCVGVTLEFLWRNLDGSVQGGVRYDNNIIMGMIVPTYYRVIVNPNLALLFFSYCTTLGLELDCHGVGHLTCWSIFWYLRN